MFLRQLIRRIVSEAYVDASGRIGGIAQRRHRSGAKTKTANEYLKWAKNSQFTCDQNLVNSNGNLRALFDMIQSVFLRQGKDLLDQFGEEEEAVFYDFAANYEKGNGYWKRMGEKIFGDDLWGYHQGVDANPSAYERFMIVMVDNDKVGEAVERIKRFGWWCHVGEPAESLGQTAVIVSPVALEMKDDVLSEGVNNSELDLTVRDSVIAWMTDHGPESIFDDEGELDWSYTDPMLGTDLEELMYEYMGKYKQVISQDEVTLYRLVKLNSLKELDLKNVGVFWSFERSGVGAYGLGKKISGDKQFVLTGIVDKNNIDWKQGLYSFLAYGKSEFECYMRKNSPVVITHVNDRETKKPISGKC